MSQPRYGSAPDFNAALDYEPPCYVCDQYEGHGCDCQPCDTCAELTAAGSLNKGLDGKTRCPECHLEADLKIICRERPAFRPSVADLAAASWTMFARGGR